MPVKNDKNGMKNLYTGANRLWRVATLSRVDLGYRSSRNYSETAKEKTQMTLFPRPSIAT